MIFSQEREKRYFKISLPKDSRHKSLERIYPFYVLPGGRAGGVDKRVFEVFYGQRPFEKVTELVQGKGPLPKIHERLLTERGATLLYERSDDGMVLCTLYPAASENYRPREDAIILAIIRDTHVLTGAPIIERHWRVFMSYMQCTCLEGDPTIGDRLRVWWLLSTRRLIVDNKTEIAKVWTVCSHILMFSVSVGLSGFLLAIVQWWFTVSGDNREKLPTQFEMTIEIPALQQLPIAQEVQFEKGNYSHGSRSSVPAS